MDYRKFGNNYIVRLDKGEEIVEKLTELIEKEGIRQGKIQGLGATNKLKIGLFDTKEKEYNAKELAGDFEICPLFGIINTMDGKPYLHLHINVADAEHHSFGGHLNYAIVSATFEAVLELIGGETGRELNEDVGLNLLKF